jgi:hypothetical protein
VVGWTVVLLNDVERKIKARSFVRGKRRFLTIRSALTFSEEFEPLSVP